MRHAKTSRRLIGSGKIEWQRIGKSDRRRVYLYTVEFHRHVLSVARASGELSFLFFPVLRRGSDCGVNFRPDGAGPPDIIGIRRLYRRK
jgi:hypothetical protein